MNVPKGVWVVLVAILIALLVIWGARHDSATSSSEKAGAGGRLVADSHRSVAGGTMTATRFDELIYRDGSANAYRFGADGDGARFEYDPVTPERSSTGMYSGGDPREGRLDATQLASLWQQVSALENNTALHVVDRGKGTGQFFITSGGDQRSFIIARGAELLAFDAFVATLR